VTRVVGRVVRTPFAVGSKQDHVATMLETEGRSYRLRREDGNPFHDPELDQFVGRVVHAAGSIDGDIFVASDIQPVAKGQPEARPHRAPESRTTDKPARPSRRR